jgi:hypothetical protein
MSAYCPECETDLDPTTGTCPACRWDPDVAQGYRTVRRPRTDEGSITDRYRGTAYDSSVQLAEVVHVAPTVSRGRVFVVIGLVIGIVVYGVVLTSMAQF